MKQLFDQYISTLIENNYRVDEAMNYSLLAKSKRLRPVLLLTLLKDLGFNPEIGLKAASSIEMIHTYSLIHDDLPAFDNDDFRRGKPTCHKAFDEEVAILAGDGLLTLAFENLTNSDYSSDVKAKLVYELAVAAGHNGMIKGQQLDKEFETKNSVSLEELIEMDNLKTGRLLTIPFTSALIIAGKEQYRLVFDEVGKKLGIAFQIQDDILDVTSTFEEIGKTTSDTDNNKTTYITLLGIEAAKEKVNSYFNEIKELLDGLDFNTENTQKLIFGLIDRKW